ncbi:hypothetical protein ACJMK2_008229 [Sinanodonta woodiana]|uniref:Uncharacterized protein n=1 Tax=Sinanodonta woodiana TaxID=1069815 RepID=A0ABD3VLF9_SINWO
MSMNFENQLEPVLSGFCNKRYEKRDFFIKSHSSKPVLAGFKLLSMSMNFENQLEQFDPVRTGINRFYTFLFYQKIRRKGLFIKSRRSKPDLAGFELLSISMNFLEPVRTGLIRLEPV